MPWNIGRPQGEHAADEAWRVRIDVAIRLNKSLGNRFDQREDAGRTRVQEPRLLQGRLDSWSKGAAMATLTQLDWRRIALQGTIGGVAGGILIDAFLYIVLFGPAHQPIAALWTNVSATATGHTIANPWLGLVIHFCVSIAWGIGYAYAAATRPAIADHPYISGVTYGLIVMIIMQFVQLAAGVKLALTATNFLSLLVAHCIFFGLPVAIYVHRAMRT